jgi:hypothetical protein
MRSITSPIKPAKKVQHQPGDLTRFHNDSRFELQPEHHGKVVA